MIGLARQQLGWQPSIPLADGLVRTTDIRSGKPIDETRFYVTSLRTSAKALLRHVRDRWSIENCWH